MHIYNAPTGIKEPPDTLCDLLFWEVQHARRAERQQRDQLCAQPE